MKIFLTLSMLLLSLWLPSMAVASGLQPSDRASSMSSGLFIKKIKASPVLSKIVDVSSIRVDWRKSPVDDLFYGIFWANYKLPNGSLVRNPTRFYVKDNGASSMVIFGDFVDASGKALDASRLVAKIISPPLKKKASVSNTGFPLNSWAIIKKGTDRIIIFTDPDCPYCRKTRPELVKLSKIRRIQLEVYYTPIDSLHPNARAKSLAILSLDPSVRLQAETILENLDSGNMVDIFNFLEANGFYSDPQSKANAKKHLRAGEDLAARYGLRGTPNILVPSTMKAIQGWATSDEILSKLKN